MEGRTFVKFFWILRDKNKKCTPRPFLRRDVISLTFRKNRKAVCKKGEPDGLLPISKGYYTTKRPICKSSNMTNFREYFCEKAYG